MAQRRSDDKVASRSRRRLSISSVNAQSSWNEDLLRTGEENTSKHDQFPRLSTSNHKNSSKCPGLKDSFLSLLSDRRLTRSASKRWLKLYKSKPILQSNFADDQVIMRPPSVPAPQSTRLSYSGVTTRLRNRNVTASCLTSDFSRISSSFSKRLSFDQTSNTSDYGTASEHSRKCSSVSGGMSPVSDSGNSCHCASMSGVESLGSTSEDDHTAEECPIDWSEKWQSNSHCISQAKITLHTAGDVCAFIPDINRSRYCGSFSVSVRNTDKGHEIYSVSEESPVEVRPSFEAAHSLAVENRSWLFRGNCSIRPLQCSSLRVHHVSAVVSMEPHGVHFYEEFPVVLVIPLFVAPQNDEWVSCLYSNTEVGSQPSWERLPRKDYVYSNGSLVITTNHFSLFTVILEEPYPEVMKTIRRRTGGYLKLDEVPGVEVTFPRGSLKQDVDAYLRVLYNYEPMLNGNLMMDEVHGALASPVIMLGPHGHTFTASQNPVRIKLPVPHYHEIQTRFGPHVQLSVWQSSTGEGEPTCWQILESPCLQIEPPAPGINTTVVSFTVNHFSFFKIVWDLLSSSLVEAKMGMSYFYPYISFSMMCQAFMEESKENTRFGLEIICYRSDKRLPDQSNYRHRVGASIKPKLVRPGRILIRLRSQMFEADVDAGEDTTMEKEEPDFRGRDFEKQYACRFKQDVSVGSGTFGKVIVERIATGKNDPLFEFNLNKSDGGHEVLQPMGSERWTAFAMKELAATLQITDGNNWKRFAQHIGFTKSEIKTKFQYSPDPFLAMMNLYGSRGGTPEEFMQALYAVSRELRLNSNGVGGSHSDGGSSGHSSHDSKEGSRDSGSRYSKGSGNKYRTFWGFRPWAQVNNDSDSDSMPADAKESAKKRSRSSLEKKEASGGGSSAKRRKFSDVSETVSSGSEAGDEEDSDPEAIKSNNQHINNRRRLNDRDMWKISKGIARKDWRFLGRTLGIEERVLIDLEHQYQPVGFRECAYQMLLEWKGRKPRKCTFGNLYSALIRENMVGIAKHMVKILPDEVEARERDLND